jgi:hypothetical protein
VLAEQFKTFPPGSVEVLLTCAESEDEMRRGRCLVLLARVGGWDRRVIQTLKKAQKDDQFLVRHNAHVAMFQVTDNLKEFLTYLIRLQEDPDAVLGPIDKDSEAGKRDLSSRELTLLGSAMLIVEWSEKRPDDLAPILLDLLKDPSPRIRRGAARLIGAACVKVDLAAGKEKQLPESPEAAKKQTPPQRSRTASRFDKLKAEDSLRELRDKDPDATVREAASMALQRMATIREQDPSPRR